MVREAEEFADEDKKVKAKVDASNKLETYCYNMKSTVEDKAKDKIDGDDKKVILDAVTEALEWLDEHSDADADEYTDKLKEVEDVTQPIIAKLYGGEGGGPDGGAEGGDDDDLGGHDEL